MNVEEHQNEDYSRFAPPPTATSPVSHALTTLTCGRLEVLVVDEPPDSHVFPRHVVLTDSLMVPSGHTFEECIKQGHDKETFPKVVEWMADHNISEFIIEVPFFRIDNFKARMGVKFIQNRSGKYNMYSFHVQSTNVEAQVPFGSYSGGGRAQILNELLDEINAQIEQAAAENKDFLHDDGYMRCRTGATRSGHRSDWVVLQAKLMRNKKFWNVWIETHVGYCVMCYANVDELPPGTDNKPEPETNLRDNGWNPAIVGKSLIAGKLPPLSARYNPNAPITDELLAEINGPGRASSANSKPAWKPKSK